jgi:hypothetical protein
MILRGMKTRLYIGRSYGLFGGPGNSLDSFGNRKGPKLVNINLTSSCSKFPFPDGSEFTSDPKKIFEFVFGIDFKSKEILKGIQLSDRLGTDDSGEYFCTTFTLKTNDPLLFDLVEKLGLMIYDYLDERFHIIHNAVEAEYQKELSKHTSKLGRFFFGPRPSSSSDSGPDPGVAFHQRVSDKPSGSGFIEPSRPMETKMRTPPFQMSDMDKNVLAQRQIDSVIPHCTDDGAIRNSIGPRG